ncbi:beta-aspartyl-peptidase [Candidatus Bipolaricaulota bacterium]|nr:beta-aspartyl-peptidase [Candidatus Bipolaricaulota bacterium]
MRANFPFTIIRGGALYSPQPQGEKDLLIAGGRIARIEEKIEPPKGLDVTVFDAAHRFIIPGFIDLHVHLIGGGGENGPASRVPEISLSTLTKAGITTAVGVLGTDGLTRSPEALLAKVKALRAEGLSAYMYTGSYRLPSVTITGSVRRDIALIQEIIGVKVAISDHRGSQPTMDELAKLASEARVGGMLAGKPGIVHVHVGGGSRGLDPILAVIKQTEIPISQFLPTHIGRDTTLLRQGIDFVNTGGCIDITVPNEANKAISIIKEFQESRIDLTKVTLSSDGNGSKPRFNGRGELTGMATGDVATLGKTLKVLVEGKVLPLPDALALITSNPADRLGISGRKGSIREGADADLLILDEELRIEQVFAKGQLMVDDGRALVKGNFE